MKALSIRQPWAWAIVFGTKRIENRDWSTRYRGKLLIHASKGMTIGEYQSATMFIERIGLAVPTRDQLQRGDLIGIADLVDVVTSSSSPWFQGKYGFVLENVRPLPNFVPLMGELGLFHVTQAAVSRCLA
ncbi:ASCH domain-containing protein [Hyphomicrobium sp. DY-1]|uniref:ASCH domain-containing protein n=1 Tax=Hyphomicrobium sp. DY-1 TaxID=3075650 RepID=UPI0039C0395A